MIIKRRFLAFFFLLILFGFLISVFCIPISLINPIHIQKNFNNSVCKSEEINPKNSWGGSANDGGYGIVLDNSSNIYITGYTESFGIEKRDLFIAKYNRSGILLWDITWNGFNDYLRGNKIVIHSNNNIFIIANSGSFPKKSSFFIKFNSSNKFEWAQMVSLNRSYAWGWDDNAKDIILDKSGNIFYTGYYRTFSRAGIFLKGFITKYNSSGIQKWEILFELKDIQVLL